MNNRIWVCLLGGLLCAAQWGQASTNFWKNNTSGSWNDGANWMGGNAPTAVDSASFTSLLINATVTIQTNNISLDGAYAANAILADWGGLTYSNSGSMLNFYGTTPSASLSLTNFYAAWGEGSSVSAYGALSDTVTFSNMSLSIGSSSARGEIKMGQKITTQNKQISGTLAAVGTNASFTAYLSQLVLGYGGASGGVGSGYLDLSQAGSVFLDVSGNVEIASSSTGESNFRSATMTLNRANARTKNLYVGYTTAAENLATAFYKLGTLTMSNSTFLVASNLYLGGRGTNSNSSWLYNSAIVNVTVGNVAGGLDIANTNSAALTLKNPTTLNADGANLYIYNQINITLGNSLSNGWCWGLRWVGNHVTNNTQTFSGSNMGLLALLDSTNQYARLRVITNALSGSMLSEHLIHLQSLNSTKYGGKTVADLTPADFIVYEGGYTYVGAYSRGPAAVDDATGPLNVTAASADLVGTLTSTGASPTTVFCFWGTSDGGAGAWANTNVWTAPQIPGLFTNHVTGLDSNTTYYYRYGASNDSAMVWAPSSTVFITGDVWVDKLSDASEIGPTPGTFTVHRASTATNTALVVNYRVSGTASNGVDYTNLNGVVTIPDGTDAVALVVSPYFDHVVEGTETVQVTITSGSYVVGSAASASLGIADYGVVWLTWNGAGANASASNPMNWVGGIAPIGGDAIRLDATTNKNMTWDMNIPIQSWLQAGYGGTVTVATVFGNTGFTNFNILGDCVISNGMWTHVNNATEVYRLKVNIGGNLVLATNGSINVSYRGWQNRNGPGSLPGDNSASYGGYTLFNGGPCYGSITSPTNIGSGGRDAPGGGAILLNVGGLVCNDGNIQSDGYAAAWGGGSGGSIWITAGGLTGAGVIEANGAKPSSDPARDSGGGRVALVITNEGADFTSYTGVCSAYGGRGGRGISGTIYREKASDPRGKGELIVDNLSGARGYGVYNTDLSGTESVTYEFSRIILTNGAILNIGADDSLIATNTVWVNTGSLLNGVFVSGGRLLAPSTFTYSNMFIGITAAGTTFNPGTTLTIGSNAEFRVDKVHELNCDVIVQPNGKLTHTANSSAESYRMNLTINGNLTVQAGGLVDVTGKGYAAGYGPGAHTVNNSGASYGGQGVGGFPCYGSVIAPTNLGSGGKGGVSGGGAIILNVSGVVSNAGRISANSTEAVQLTGSGGSIYITAGALLGSGPIQANGATNVTGSGPGGGGRIALVVTNAGADFSAYPSNMITAYGGKKTGASGGAGTICLRNAGQGTNEGTLFVDNNNMVGLSAEISSNVIDAVVANVVLRNQGNLLLASNQNIWVSGIWSNGGSFAGQWGSQVIFGGGVSSTSIVYGTNLFMGLTSTNAGKVMLFQAGKTNSIAALGQLTLKGVDTTNLILRSTQDGAAWKLNVNGAAAQNVQQVDVKDSDAMTGVGTEISAVNSTDNGNNLNWRFVTVGSGETNVWTGSSNTVWAFNTNWSLGRTPIESDYIQIPSGRSRYPVLAAAVTLNALEIQSGASLTLGGYDLTVVTNAVVVGSLVASATETITLQGDANFTGASFTSARTTVALAGGGNQAVNLGNLTYYKIAVLNSAGTVAFNNAFTATEFRCEAPTGTRNITFQQGATVTLRDLFLLGSVSSTNITLRSSSGGQKWNLAVSGYRGNVQGVDVQDSDASGGLPVPAVSSRDSGNNVNWAFDASWSTWVGASNSNFHTAANWSPAGVPGATTRVLVDSSVAMTVTGAVTVLDFVVGGNTSAASVTVNAALTVGENITVLSNGTLALNRPCVVTNGLYIFGGGILTHSVNTSSEANKVDVTVMGKVGIDPNGSIYLTGKGYAAGSGPGVGSYNGYNGGGSYGGVGSGNAPCYGSIVAPTNLGSGSCAYTGSPGGGAVRLSVAGELRHDGTIYANGVGVNYYAGSGGSIYLTSGTLIGTGIMQANGSPGGAPGGGGRISLAVTNAGADFSLYSGTVQALGGSGGASAGAGTIYMRTGAQGPNEGTLVVDNNLVTSNPTEISSSVRDASVGNVLIRNIGFLRVNSNQTLMVSGVWSNMSSFAAQWGSQVIFAGGASSTSAVYGNSTFMGLVCSNAGKTLLFQAGKTNTVADQGRLTLSGNVGANVRLHSQQEGTRWKLNVNTSVVQSVEFVDVMDSDGMTNVGAQISALNSVDSGNNLNWNFVNVSEGETNGWTGAGSTAWSAVTNWSLGRAPFTSDYIMVPAGRVRYPSLDNVVLVKGLEIQSGASLSLAGYNLTVSDSLTVAGSLTALGTERISLPGTANFTGGTVNPVRSTVTIEGSTDQVINLGNATFYKVEVLNSAGTVTFANGFTATELRCEAASGTRTLLFQPGVAVNLRDLVLLGAIGGTNITVQSVEPSQAWGLAVTGYRSIRGVAVQDSDAHAGLPLVAANSQDDGNNINWLFDVSPSMWLGVSNSNFHTAANWSPSGVPGAASRVSVDSSVAMTITGAVSVLDFVVGGGTGAASVTVNAALNVGEDITVLSNGTLTLNRPCVVTNNLNVLAGGVLTHSANTTTEANKLNMTVFGNVTVDYNGSINVMGKGYQAFYGPGYLGGDNSASYGGVGWNGGVCYGSVVSPTNLGSGGRSSAGGGVILLNVGGTLRNDGILTADGAPYDYGGGSGGSIGITAGALSGSSVAVIRSKGGISANLGRHGGGGRISLVVTNTGADFSGYLGTILAGGTYGAGTIYKQIASDRAGRGTVWVDNSGLTGLITEMPPSSYYVAGEVDRATFVVTNGATLRLVNDFSAGDIGLQSANTVLDLNYKTVLIHSRQHTFTGTVGNWGTIIWIPDVAGTVFSIR